MKKRKILATQKSKYTSSIRMALLVSTVSSCMRKHTANPPPATASSVHGGSFVSRAHAIRSSAPARTARPTLHRNPARNALKGKLPTRNMYANFRLGLEGTSGSEQCLSIRGARLKPPTLGNDKGSHLNDRRCERVDDVAVDDLWGIGACVSSCVVEGARDPHPYADALRVRA